ncbi:hypothetical protein MKK75_03185 [Methylobacterium sp. J-030]|uniref:hypothetical protein n=1 Tax=Methylobacterium sp. J-030 TaxID=2836627 RepID=UPI001FBB62F7|nr:hypothetical protein [Methylobacterium sp. J-030]MCJ2067820.1 hypothetical protein [Methylobacterium sp. J-030]
MPNVYGSEGHRAAARRHAIRRAAQRYGLAFVMQDVIEHEAMIRYGLTKLVLWSGNESSRAELHEIAGEFRSYFAVFNPQIRCIVTYIRGPHEWPARCRRVA